MKFKTFSILPAQLFVQDNLDLPHKEADGILRS